MRKITRNNIKKNNMVALNYCQCQRVLGLFGGDFKIGYNSGVYGWNYDLYEINGVSVVTGYNVPYKKYNNQELKKKLIALENKITKEYNFNFAEYEENKKKFLEIFE